MKRGIFRAVVALSVAMALCTAANAYYPHLTVRACPHCKAHVVVEETLSGNTIGAVIYTDGKREAPMLPDHPLLAKCPACGGLFWVDEVVAVASGFEAAEGKSKVLRPSEGDLIAFLNGADLTRGKEAYVRQRAWWAANDVWRRDPGAAAKGYSEAQVKNVKAFAELLDEKVDDQRIMRAEIARELGQFEECLRLLGPPAEEGFQYAVDLIRRLAREGDSIVRPFAD